MSCGGACRRGSDPALLWLWRRLAATVPIGPLAWEPPYATEAAQEIAKRQKKKLNKNPEAIREKYGGICKVKIGYVVLWRRACCWGFFFFFFFFLFFFFFFCLFSVAHAAYGGSQARGLIRAVASVLHQNHGNSRSLTHWVRPGIEPTTSWFLVGFINHWATTGTLEGQL